MWASASRIRWPPPPGCCQKGGGQLGRQRADHKDACTRGGPPLDTQALDLLGQALSRPPPAEIPVHSVGSFGGGELARAVGRAATREAMSAAATFALGSPGASSPVRRSRLRKLFDLFDYDDDGVLGRDDVLYMCSTPMVASELQWVACDAEVFTDVVLGALGRDDGTGGVTFDGFCQIWGDEGQRSLQRQSIPAAGHAIATRSNGGNSSGDSVSGSSRFAPGEHVSLGDLAGVTISSVGGDSSYATVNIPGLGEQVVYQRDLAESPRPITFATSPPASVRLSSLNQSPTLERWQQSAASPSAFGAPFAGTRSIPVSKDATIAATPAGFTISLGHLHSSPTRVMSDGRDLGPSRQHGLRTFSQHVMEQQQQQQQQALPWSPPFARSARSASFTASHNRMAALPVQGLSRTAASTAWTHTSSAFCATRTAPRSRTSSRGTA